MRWLLILFLTISSTAVAQNVAPGALNINVGTDLFSTERIFQLIALLTVLSLAPKSVTSPIAIGVADQIGGFGSLAAGHGLGTISWKSKIVRFI